MQKWSKYEPHFFTQKRNRYIAQRGTFCRAPAHVLSGWSGGRPLAHQKSRHSPCGFCGGSGFRAASFLAHGPQCLWASGRRASHDCAGCQPTFWDSYLNRHPQSRRDCGDFPPGDRDPFGSQPSRPVRFPVADGKNERTFGQLPYLAQQEMAGGWDSEICGGCAVAQSGKNFWVKCCANFSHFAHVILLFIGFNKENVCLTQKHLNCQPYRKPEAVFGAESDTCWPALASRTHQTGRKPSC